MTESKLPTELKEPWLKALRSGEYQQGQYALEREDNGLKYCCIGVYNKCHGMEQDYTLERIIGKDAINQLVELNDSYGKSFLEIADHIETNL